jgi:hypothetical protein
VSGEHVCPECSTTVEHHWEWCHNCGFDPEGNRPADTPLLSSATPLAGSGAGLFGGGTFEAGAFDTGLTPFEPAPFEPAPFEPAQFEPAPFEPAAFGSTFEPFDATAPGSFETPVGGAFDALQSLTGDSRPGESWPGGDGLAGNFWPGEGEGSGDLMAGPASALAAWDSAPPPTSPGLPHPPAAPNGPGLSATLGRSPGTAGERPGTNARAGRSVPFGLRRGIAVALGGVLVLGALTVGATKLASSPRPRLTTTSLDPSSPPPIGQLPLGGSSARRSETAPPVLEPGWETYRADDDTFTANFPGTPKSSAVARPASLPTGPMVQVGLARGDSFFSVQFLDDAVALDFFPEQAGWRVTGPYEVSPGIVATGFEGDTPAGLQRGFALKRGPRIYLVLATNASNEEFHSFIHGFRWLADPT